MKKNYIVSLDLDETLLKSDTTLSDYTVSIMNQLIEKGIYVVANTARSHTIIPKDVSKINFSHYICSNGSSIYDVNKKEIIFTHNLNKDRIREILDRTNNLPFATTLTTINGLYSTPKFKTTFSNSTLPKDKMDEIINSRIYVDDLLEVVNSSQEIQKVHFNFPDNTKHLYEDCLKDISDITITSSHQNNLEINSPNASKGKTIHTYAKLMNIDSPYILAYGDNLNDLSQMRHCDRFTAMKNAHPEVLAQTMRISEFTNEEDGVAKDLSDYFKI